jgi:acetate kinase
MKVLVINSGSSSIKYQLLDMDDETAMVSGAVERIGEDDSEIEQKNRPGSESEKVIEREESIADHEQGMKLIVELLADPEDGVISDKSDIDAIGHRVVHGGERFFEPTLIDDDVVDGIEANVPLAPLHNPGHLDGIRTTRRLFPDAPQVAVFDTAFHQTMPPKAYHYAVPYELYEELGVRRYGFHGTSHKYVAGKASELLCKSADSCNLITVHMGNGASITEIRGGKSVDTSMGMTPLAGVIMGTRSGNIDPAIIRYLHDRKGMSIEEIDRMLTKESGLKGVCGSNDMRDIHERIENGDERAGLALDMSVHRTRQYMGAYFWDLVDVDAVVFTAGIGENDPVYRELCCKDLGPLGIVMDEDKNRDWNGESAFVNAEHSPVKIMVIPTNEELEIAKETAEVVSGGAK